MRVVTFKDKLAWVRAYRRRAGWPERTFTFPSSAAIEKALESCCSELTEQLLDQERRQDSPRRVPLSCIRETWHTSYKYLWEPEHWSELPSFPGKREPGSGYKTGWEPLPGHPQDVITLRKHPDRDHYCVLEGNNRVMKSKMMPDAPVDVHALVIEYPWRPVKGKVDILIRQLLAELPLESVDLCFSPGDSDPHKDRRSVCLVRMHQPGTGVVVEHEIDGAPDRRDLLALHLKARRALLDWRRYNTIIPLVDLLIRGSADDCR